MSKIATKRGFKERFRLLIHSLKWMLWFGPKSRLISKDKIQTKPHKERFWRHSKAWDIQVAQNHGQKHLERCYQWAASNFLLPLTAPTSMENWSHWTRSHQLQMSICCSTTVLVQQGQQHLWAPHSAPQPGLHSAGNSDKLIKWQQLKLPGTGNTCHFSNSRHQAHTKFLSSQVVTLWTSAHPLTHVLANKWFCPFGRTFVW